MARIAVFIDHDIMLRHFVHTGVLRPLEREHDVVYVFPEKHKRVTQDVSKLELPRVRTVAVDMQRAHLYRRLYAATVLMRMRPTPDKRILFRFWKEMLGPQAFYESWLHSWPWTNARYKRRMLEQIGENAPLDALLDDERPDVIVHPTVLEGLFVSDLVRWGERRGVPTVYLMNSWDNPAVKAIMLGPPDRLVVWGEHSRQLAHERIGVPLDRLLAFGAAQFDVYRQPPRESRDAYRRRLGVVDGLPILMYAGSSKGLDETAHLVRLEEAIESGRMRRCAVLYRPHPWRGKGAGEESFYSRRWRHVIMCPAMADFYKKNWDGEAAIDMADYEETHVALSAVDAVVSPISTILLEAALHGKPVAAYLGDDEGGQNLFIFTVVRTVHFREFFEKVDCLRIQRAEDLVPSCTRLMDEAADPSAAAALKAQCEYFVAPGERSYADRLADLVRELAGRERARQAG
jgi:hypothetical protein